jgi:hypothetical protein
MSNGDNMLTQKEIDTLLSWEDPKVLQPIHNDSFVNDLENDMKTNVIKGLSYVRPTKKIQHQPKHSCMDRKTGNKHICHHCKNTMEHVFIFQPNAGQKRKLVAWCSACNFYHHI